MRLCLQILIILVSLFLVSCNETPPTNNKVVTCITIDECPIGTNCIDGFCQKEGKQEEECIDNTDCPSGFICNSNSQCEQKTCESKADCGTGKICFNKRCIEGCDSNSDCSNNETCNTQTNKCEKGEDCRIENTCEQGYECDQLSGRCVVNLTCDTTADCASGYKCDNSQCVEKIKCESDDECTGNNEVCRADGYCDIDIGCDSDEYCTRRNPQKPACSLNSGICYECTSNEHCTNLSKPICNTMTHVCGTQEGPSGECLADSDCGMNKRCNTAVNPHECVDMVTSCHSDNDCQNSMHCKSDGRCVMCLGDSQCTAPTSSCNTNTNLCEDPSGSGSGGESGSCDNGGYLACLLMGGNCDGPLGISGNCVTPTDPCAGVTCPTYSTCSNGACNCNSGYHSDGNNCVQDVTDPCAGINCTVVNSHCSVDSSNNAGCYCDTGFTAKDTNNDGQKDTCVEDVTDPCSGITCSNHGSCINNSGVAACNCDAGYHTNGLYCIQDSQTCDLDQFSNPLNDTSTNARTIDFGTYDNLTLGNSNCGYVEDWYKIELYPNTEFKLNLSFIDANGDIDVKLYKAPDTTTSVKSSGGSTDTESITYVVTEQATYYIRVYIYFESEQRVNTYSMTISSRAVQSGNPGTECTSDNDCYGDGAYCVKTYTSNGYCSNTCPTAGASCMDSGVCGTDNGNCFRKCSVGDDSTCLRDDLVCEDGSNSIGGVCVKKCYANSDCSNTTNYCNTSIGHCEINYMTCNDDRVSNSGCSTTETCFNDNDGKGTYCFPNNGKNIDETCQYTNDCKAGLGCVGNDTDGYKCTEYCKTNYDCNDFNDVCTLFPNETYGYCN